MLGRWRFSRASRVILDDDASKASEITLLQNSGGGRHHPVRSTGNAFLHHHVPFPITLHALLKDNPCPSAICWNAEGTKVILHTTHKEFDNILCSYFGDIKFSSLKRKANRWTFRTKCVHSETSKYHIWNNHFLRDKDPACFDICPAEAKKAGQKKAEATRMPPRSSTTAADNKRSTSAGTTGTHPTLVTASTNDALAAQFI